MRHDDIPLFWKKKIKEKFGRERLLESDFEYGPIEIKFEDRSLMHFFYYTDIVDEERDEMLLLTEHCGYHIVPLGRGYNTIKRK